MSHTRRALLLTAFAASVAPPAFAQVSDHMTIGAATAPLHLTEFASLTCGHCAHFHESNWRTLKTRYIDTGRVRFTLHEMLTPPPAVALGMFQVARCNGASADEYMRRVSILFERQAAILGSGTLAGVRDALVAAGAEWGLTHAQVLASLSDPAGAERIRRSIASSEALGISQTPSFLFNGVRGTDQAFVTPEGMVRILDARLAAL
jgi:protein-disulfide isomerase